MIFDDSTHSSFIYRICDSVYDSIMDSVYLHIRQIVALHVRHYTGNSAHQAVAYVMFEKIKSYDT
jgi:hypothetical protein